MSRRPLTVSALGRRFGLSRSTLLYYDRIGLLRPSSRAANGYRQYTEDDARRLEQICSFRRAGIPLEQIRRVLDSPSGSLARVLEQRLADLERDIERLRAQQQFIIGVLGSGQRLENADVMDKKRWRAILAASGFSREDMRRWHAEFERHSPRKHLEFLRFLCIPDEEIADIRRWSKEKIAGDE